MKEYIVKEYETFPYKGATKEMPELIRCKDCENHGTRTNMCDIWHRHTNAEGYCHRAKAKSKEQKAKCKGGEEG